MISVFKCDASAVPSANTGSGVSRYGISAVGDVETYFSISELHILVFCILNVYNFLFAGGTRQL